MIRAAMLSMPAPGFEAILGELMPDEAEVKAFVSRAPGHMPSETGEELAHESVGI